MFTSSLADRRLLIRSSFPAENHCPGSKPQSYIHRPTGPLQRERGKPRVYRENLLEDPRAVTRSARGYQTCSPGETPRVRGDERRAELHHGVEQGRPPRARGRAHRGGAPVSCGRKTPACAGTSATASPSTSTRAEDPRVRGDEELGAWGSRTRHGRPPRARGRGPAGDRGRAPGRKTPACAGTRQEVTGCRRRPVEDPRVRGDEHVQHEAHAVARGRPPRARGRVDLPLGLTETAGKTPACAGTRRARARRAADPQEDPRVRGDEDDAFPRLSLREGRPPRARGREAHRPRPDRGARKTPACAGTRCSPISPPNPVGEDPRVRGDEEFSAMRRLRLSGRPPRARGRDGRGVRRRVAGGKTPACAGTSTDPVHTPDTAGEDPRVRGDELVHVGRVGADEGRPPRARGRGWRGAAARSGPRKTPACAGTRRGASPASPAVGEDPRVRGDEDTDALGGGGAGGRPPRARGRDDLDLVDLDHGGKTPACAGTSPPRGCASLVRTEDPRVRGDEAY